MSTLTSNFDSIEKLIDDEGLRIVALDLHPGLDVMLVVLNTGAVLKRPLSAYKRLKDAPEDVLRNFRFVSDGAGIHWPALDEDLSLKGFLRDELLQVVHKNIAAA